MKRLGMVLIFGLLSAYCFAQSQTGNASYNPSKGGLNIYHPSISIGRRVRVINLRNNSEVIATVNGRITGDSSRIADVSRDAGDAIGMSRSGYTEVRIELLPHEQPVAAAAPVPAPAPPAAPPQEQPAPVPAAAPIVQYITVPQAQTPAAPAAPAPAAEPVQNCPLSPAVIVLLALAVALLTAILALLIHARRVPWWPGHPWWFGRYPLWARRRIRHLKKRRI
ncbi:MAG: hypothetical protein LBG14_06585 [Treponema sp.]|jgi:hypothetical protein|nr:hypothetical protein [Treponema sp.]